MKTAYDLLMSCPDGQTMRCRLAFKAAAAGDWQDAAHWLLNAAAEETGIWKEEAAELGNHFLSLAGPS